MREVAQKVQFKAPEVTEVNSLSNLTTTPSEFVTNHCDMQPGQRREKVKQLALANFEAGIVSTLREAIQGPKKQKADKMREVNIHLAEAYTAPFFDPDVKFSNMPLEVAQTLPNQYAAYLSDKLKEEIKVKGACQHAKL